MKKVAWKTEIVKIVLRRYCDYVLPNMYKNILKCWSENHSCTWSKGLFKTVYEKKSWTWPILELWGWYKTLGRAGLSYKGEEGSVWTSTFPHLLFTLFSIWLKHTLWNSVWEESTGPSFQRYIDLISSSVIYPSHEHEQATLLSLSFLIHKIKITISTTEENGEDEIECMWKCFETINNKNWHNS